mmetsp:Transcript_9334/g.23219  ORF Transcript_9334/g.23219 Transcript_9334/m.23219 type:complete len:200 (-) Transcript_9334:480-1079(-)
MSSTAAFHGYLNHPTNELTCSYMFSWSDFRDTSGKIHRFCWDLWFRLRPDLALETDQEVQSGEGLFRDCQCGLCADDWDEIIDSFVPVPHSYLPLSNMHDTFPMEQTNVDIPVVHRRCSYLHRDYCDWYYRYSLYCHVLFEYLHHSIDQMVPVFPRAARVSIFRLVLSKMVRFATRRYEKIPSICTNALPTPSGPNLDR